MTVGGIERLGSWAAIASAVLAAGMLAIVVWVFDVGPWGASTPIDVAVAATPGAFVALDLLKLAQAACAIVIVTAMAARLRDHHPAMACASRALGTVATFCLAANALGSLWLLATAIRGTAPPPTLDLEVGAVQALGALALGVNGVWYLLVGRARADVLPRWLARLALTMGLASLVPPLALLVLVASVPWSAGLAQTLRHPSVTTVAMKEVAA